MAVNVSDLVREAAQRDPSGVALIEPRTEREVTWSELDEWVDRVARALLGLGLVAGNRVGLVMVNGIDLCVAYFGLLRGGMVAVPMSPRATPAEIGHMVTDSQVKLVVGDADSVTQVRAAELGNARIVVHRVAPLAGEIRFGSLLESAPTVRPVAPPDPESLAVVLYTAGSSGVPRGAMLTHRALLANIDQVAAVQPPVVTPDDVVLGILPLSHIYGLNCVLGQTVKAGARLVLVGSFNAEDTLRLVAEHGITNLPLAPPVIAAWAGRRGVAEALQGVRVVVSGASALDPDVAETFRESTGHPVEQGYGVTEASPVLTMTWGQHAPGTAARPGTVGKPVPGVELELRDPLGGLAAPGDPAQVWVRGPNLFSGYWPDGLGGPGEDGWYATGDLGYLDEGGELVLVDRLREMVKVSGFTVYPSEVEDVIAEVSGVDQVAVIGLPDERTGETVVAFVVPRDLEHGDEAALSARVLEECRLRLARFKVPSKVAVVAGLPHSPTGKVAKGRLRALARSELLGIDPS